MNQKKAKEIERICRMQGLSGNVYRTAKRFYVQKGLSTEDAVYEASVRSHKQEERI